ncbi:MAG: cache domain-containing protein [Nitrospirae bacterium]|nr:cache domain-containing protein [Nitrospirota bacterium]
MNTFERYKRSPIKSYAWLVMAMVILMLPAFAAAGDIKPKMQQKINEYKKKAVEWAAHPEIVKATREANAKGPIMGNLKWRELKDDDPLLQSFSTNATAKLMIKFMETNPKGINKIALSGNKGHRVAYTPVQNRLAYIAAGKPNFDESLDGNVWQQGESKPDPNTNIDSVQITVPVKDGGKVIGVLLLSLTAANLQ